MPRATQKSQRMSLMCGCGFFESCLIARRSLVMTCRDLCDLEKPRTDTFLVYKAREHALTGGDGETIIPHNFWHQIPQTKCNWREKQITQYDKSITAFTWMYCCPVTFLLAPKVQYVLPTTCGKWNVLRTHDQMGTDLVHLLKLAKGTYLSQVVLLHPHTQKGFSPFSRTHENSFYQETRSPKYNSEFQRPHPYLQSPNSRWQSTALGLSPAPGGIGLIWE